MEALKFGPLSIEETDSGVRFQLQWGPPADLAANDLPLLMDFLKQHLEVTANRRSSWRLPLNSLGGTEADNLVVTIHRGEYALAAKAMDISLTGMFVLTPEPIGERGDTVDVEVVFDGGRALLQGSIVRQDSSMRRVGLHFHKCIGADGSLCPPEAYLRIFNRLEQIWMDRKLGLVWS